MKRRESIGIRPLEQDVRPIDSGILTGKGERLSAAAQQFIEFCDAGSTG